MSDLFGSLLEYKWRDVAFPTSSFRLALRQDLVAHRFVQRDGAHLEAVGRAPLEFEARIPFKNNLFRGDFETWEVGLLYPFAFRKFLAACADRSDGDLQHPELGIIRAKCERCDVDWTSVSRDGVDVSVTWIEQTTDPNKLAEIIADVSPVIKATQSANTLDSELATITPPLPNSPKYKPTFGDAMLAIQGVFDQATLLSRRAAGIVDEIGYRLDAIETAAFTASRSQADAVNHVLNWPLRNAIQSMRSALVGLRDSLLAGSKPIALYYPSTDTTLPMLSITIGAALADLMKLNPSLMGKPFVPRNSRVRFYKA